MKHLLCVLGLIVSTGAFASLPSETDAKDLYGKRGSDFMNAKKSADMYEQLAANTSDKTAKARYMVGQADSLYFYAVNLSDDTLKKDTLKSAYEIADKAISLLESSAGVPADANNTDLLAEAYYSFGANKAKWGSEVGIIKAARQWWDLSKKLELGKKLNEEVGDYGFARVLGIGHHRVPNVPFVSKSDKSAVVPNIEAAYDNTLIETPSGYETSNRVGTTLYYLEIKSSSSFEDVDQFCDAWEAFQDMTQADYDAILPEKAPENKMDLDGFNDDPSSEQEDIKEYADEEC
jgi:hypothetical protein